MFKIAKGLAKAGVLGLNKRNAEFIMALNPRHLYPRVDDKVLTKKLAQEAGIAVPEMYGVISSQAEVRRLPEIVANHESFVIKPAQGSGGNGIMVIGGRSKRSRDSYRTISGVIVSQLDLEHHISNVVGGQYSLGGKPDCALIEYCVEFDPLFADVSYLGVPDIRVIVYKGYPVMAMVRLPTRVSSGKANLHQGAVGAGLDIGTGRTMRGVLGNSVIDDHPDTGFSISGLQVPRWDFILETSARGYEMTGLGYLGVDMVIDRHHGPLMLEMNARPGLNIQIANGCGIGTRTARIDELIDSTHTPAERAALSRREFSSIRQGSLALA